MALMDLKDIYRKSVKYRKIDEIKLTLTSEKKEETYVYKPVNVKLRYGTNPHQWFSLFTPAEWNFRIEELKTGKDGLSLSNIEDIYRAANFLKYFSEPTCAIMKHLNPIGAATSSSLIDAFQKAWHSDWIAAFGSVVVFNKPVGREMAELLAEREDEKAKYFIDVVAAPDFSAEALEVLGTRKDLRVVKVIGIERLPKFEGDSYAPLLKTIGTADDMLAIEKPYTTRIRKVEDLLAPEFESNGNLISGVGVVTKRKPAQKELEDMVWAWYLVGSLRSNSIAIVKNKCIISVAAGHHERLWAIETALKKAKRLDVKSHELDIDRHKYHDYTLKGSVIASDGFSPFPDNIEILPKSWDGKSLIKCFIQPGGSVKDKEVIEAADKNNMTMIFTGERCFSHH